MNPLFVVYSPPHQIKSDLRLRYSVERMFVESAVHYTPTVSFICSASIDPTTSDVSLYFLMRVFIIHGSPFRHICYQWRKIKRAFAIQFVPIWHFENYCSRSLDLVRIHCPYLHFRSGLSISSCACKSSMCMTNMIRSILKVSSTILLTKHQSRCKSRCKLWMTRPLVRSNGSNVRGRQNTHVYYPSIATKLLPC